MLLMEVPQTVREELVASKKYDSCQDTVPYDGAVSTRRNGRVGVYLQTIRKPCRTHQDF